MRKTFLVSIALICGLSASTFAVQPAPFIKQFEGFSATPYKDSSGFSIGYGHFILKGEHFTKITESEGEKLLAKDLISREKCVDDNVEVKLTENQRTALVSLVYNIGIGAFENSTLLEELNKGHFDRVIKEFARWNKSQGRVLPALVARRATEAELFAK